MGTRIQDKSRPTKRPQAEGTYSEGVFSLVKGKEPRPDERGFPEYGGVPSPVIVSLTEVE